MKRPFKFTHVSEELADPKVFSGRWGGVENPVPMRARKARIFPYRLTLTQFKAMLELGFSRR
jgi:hypothetical protein